MNYNRRVANLRAHMSLNNKEAILLPLDATMEYFTGVPRLFQGHTKQRQKGSAFGVCIITLKEIAVFMADLHVVVTKAKLGNKPINAKIIEIEDYSCKTITDFINDNNLSNSEMYFMDQVEAGIIITLLRKCNINFVDASEFVYEMRSVKDDDEINTLKNLSKITDKIFYELISNIKIGDDVKEKELFIEYLIHKHGGGTCSFEGELNCFGKKAGAMVGDGHSKIEAGYVLGLDIGIYKNGYCTDFGRTIFIGEPTQEHKQYHKIVLESFNESRKIMIPGISCEKIHDKSVEVFNNYNLKENYIHKLGHGIGKDVHEYPLLSECNKSVIKSGMVFAVEPSIFIPHNCFIRIENMVLVTDNSNEILSKVSLDYIVIE